MTNEASREADLAAEIREMAGAGDFCLPVADAYGGFDEETLATFASDVEDLGAASPWGFEAFPAFLGPGRDEGACLLATRTLAHERGDLAAPGDGLLSKATELRARLHSPFTPERLAAFLTRIADVVDIA